MRKTAWLAAFAIILSTMVIAGPQVAVLDGTSWKINVEPDPVTKDTGETHFKDTLTFADGKISLSAPKVGFWASPYSVSKTGEKNYTFKAERASEGEGTSIWTGVVDGDKIEGKLIWTKNDGAVLTFAFKGDKLD